MANKFLNYLNDKHNNIRFTCELENNLKLPFLDILITRDNTSFCTSVFRKQTFTGMAISLFSHCDFKYKLNCIKTLICRGFRICSSFHSVHLEFVFLKNFFKNNGYPHSLIDKCVCKFLKDSFQGCQISTARKKYFFICLPYFGYQSVKLKK